MRYEFAECQLDEGARSLTRGGRARHVQPKVFDLLLFLLRHRGRVVSRRILERALWPEVVVSDAALNRLIKEARRAVGDGGQAQTIIRTIHRRGYQLAAEVAIVGTGSSLESLRAIELARLALEEAIDSGAGEMRERVREFASICEDLVRRSQQSVT